MSLLRHFFTASHEYCNTVEAQENDLKVSFMIMIEVLKNEMKNPLKEIRGKKKTQKLEKINKSPSRMARKPRRKKKRKTSR